MHSAQVSLDGVIDWQDANRTCFLLSFRSNEETCLPMWPKNCWSVSDFVNGGRCVAIGCLRLFLFPRTVPTRRHSVYFKVSYSRRSVAWPDLNFTTRTKTASKLGYRSCEGLQFKLYRLSVHNLYPCFLGAHRGKSAPRWNERLNLNYPE